MSFAVVSGTMKIDGFWSMTAVVGNAWHFLLLISAYWVRSYYREFITALFGSLLGNDSHTVDIVRPVERGNNGEGIAEGRNSRKN